MILLAIGCFATMAAAQKSLPNPVLVLVSVEQFEASGKQFTRYVYSVDNRVDFPNELFASAPQLPPCGANTKASRTWLDFYDQHGKRLWGFCALGDHDALGHIWFAMESGVVPPSWVYIELNDRQTGTRYKSNLAETSL
jgi:hypothetical protein